MFTPQQKNLHVIKYKLKLEIGQSSTNKGKATTRASTIGKGKEKTEPTIFLDTYQDAQDPSSIDLES